MDSPLMDMEKEKCKECDGNGYTAEHDSPDRHGEYGECLNCPVQVPCEKCEGTGFLSLQKESECCDADKKTSGQWHNENCFYRDITESTERIVILYANLSGRESSNRAEFRLEVEKILCNLISQREKEIAEEVEKSKYPDANEEELDKKMDSGDLTGVLLIVKKSGWNNCSDKVLSILKH